MKSDKSDLYSFVFRGLLAEEALDKTERRSKFQINEESLQELASRLSIDLLGDEFTIRASRMSQVYTAIAAFENSLREFVSNKLQEAHPEKDWWSDPEVIPSSIKSKAEKRQAEEDKIRWHSPRGDDSIYYSDFGDMISIIVKNWDLFEPHCNDQEWVKFHLKTLERSRNIIMHSGELGRVDIERVGASIRDWLTQVGA